ncbi:MAG TPA: conjugal transfer protein TraH [Candidatus Thiothrix moscowensis]|uniref:conjugal transfer protein TraH n=1 Tax=unclassified Thiothrix TaxID=2636184 RepID=UPI0025D982D9|nr:MULTISPECIES: conjugal transfer protein TraH [unclassified Thiothrix]HRJ52245.1 conjugal transfer protein TraH [Candidatus Thiothrix moscowensis]HRJ92560.1 conjugal transfer protein TraH [Candidatus Thiothrix moscowensis]
MKTLRLLTHTLRVWVIAVFLAGTAQADLASDMGSFFDDLNYANVTPGGAYKGQSATYYTGGSAFVRVPARTYTLGSIQFPSFRAGCGGIDLFAGGFSFINKEQLVAMLRNIGSAAVSYGFMVGMRSLSPQLTATLEKLQDWSQQFNNFQINSCEEGARLVGGALSQFSREKSACLAQKTAPAAQGGQGMSHAEALMACTTGGERNSTNNNGDPNSPASIINATEGNVAWRALMKNAFFSSNTAVAEVMMNLSGTVVTYKNGVGDDALTISHTVPSILMEGKGIQLLNTLLQGGSVPIVGCADGFGEMQCRDVTAGRTVNIPAPQALVTRVQNILQAIDKNITTDDKLSAEQQGLLASTSLPVYKYLTVQAVYLPGTASNTVDTYALLIAKDILATYLNDLLGKVTASSALIKSNEKDDAKFQAFKDGIFQARSEIRKYKDDVGKAFDDALTFSASVQNQEKAILGNLTPGLFQSVMFGVN